MKTSFNCIDEELAEQIGFGEEKKSSRADGKYRVGAMAKRLRLGLGVLEERTTKKRASREKRESSSSNGLLTKTDLGFAREKRLPAIVRVTEIRSEEDV